MPRKPGSGSVAGCARAALAALGLGVLVLTPVLEARASAARKVARGEPRVGQAFHWSGRLAAGRTLEVKGINGQIRAELASGEEAEVDARRTARRSDPNQVMIEVVENGNGMTVCARYPKPGGGLNDCDHPQRVRDNDVRVDFVVRVPAGVRLVAETVNGGIEAETLQGEISATTVNGSVRIATNRAAEATTVNGSITARLESDHGSDELHLETVNGFIRLELPPDFGADVSAQTVNGEIVTDFPMQVTGLLNRHRLEGTIGAGGRRVRLKTENGSIYLRRI